MVAGHHPVVTLAVEGIIDHGAGRLAAKAPAPRALRIPIAQFGIALGLAPLIADDCRSNAPALDFSSTPAMRERATSPMAKARNSSASSQVIGMGNARRVAGNGHVVQLVHQNGRNPSSRSGRSNRRGVSRTTGIGRLQSKRGDGCPSAPVATQIRTCDVLIQRPSAQ